MAPEIISGHEYDFKVDVWSLGVIFYEIASGDSARNARFDSVTTEAEVSEKLRSMESNLVNSKDARQQLSLETLERFRRMDGDDPEIPICQLLRMMLEFDPDARPSATEALAHLKIMGPFEPPAPWMHDYTELSIQKYERAWERYISREDAENMLKEAKILAAKFKANPRQNRVHENLHALCEHSKEIAPELLGRLFAAMNVATALGRMLAGVAGMRAYEFSTGLRADTSARGGAAWLAFAGMARNQPLVAASAQHAR